ncbi:prepilin-type N-terminal cleavage/methylation domain-containing protein [Fimbriimonas ginsengisoli]|uniref:Prepilin-type N-terminal cleavage/methylation domain-containing protein n=1 Tax=Fimbriimonas ginsengisoli Gsoil 348 TaxID=661478 RepID=A0A068NKX4_FIMGI|nr:prepilin-type N-terminal cleavage/methylation domain-containing protein [Fimbriimonas ginsengisoli]AIE84052.1 hypothetical protein OP10G_0684 [Fimbriimonas ginsengisoli Gsoil 348]
MRGGFTLIELLVVVAILALLAAILFPVLSSAKRAAKSSACIAHEAQLGVALGLYAVDFDDGLPGAGEDQSNDADGSEIGGDSWLDTVQPYSKSRLIYRCPADESPNWEALIEPRQTSYGLNAFFAPNHPPFFGFKLDQVNHPSECVLVAELAETWTEDHFSPMYWGTPSLVTDALRQESQWNAAIHQPKPLDELRHPGGSNYLFSDFHAKKSRFSRLWHQSSGVKPSIDQFDPTW